VGVVGHAVPSRAPSILVIVQLASAMLPSVVPAAAGVMRTVMIPTAPGGPVCVDVAKLSAGSKRRHGGLLLSKDRRN